MPWHREMSKSETSRYGSTKGVHAPRAHAVGAAHMWRLAMKKQELKQNPELRIEDNQVKGRKDRKLIEISLLVNSLCYFLEIVFIPGVKEGYRLVVIRERKLLTDKIYKTIKDAREAFLKRYGKYAWRDSVKPYWSLFCPPIKGWLDKNLSYKKATGHLNKK